MSTSQIEPQVETGTVAKLSHRQVLTVFAGVGAGMFLAALDQTIVATALPTIVGELGGLEQLSWVVTAYLLASTVSTPLYGKLSDLYGRKTMFQIAIVVFLIGSMASGMAQSMTQLVTFRGVQGIGAGGLMAMAFAVMADVVSPRQRGKYSGYLAGVFAVSSIGGPLLGGFLVDQLSWRWVFYVNLPVGIAAFVIITKVLRVSVARVHHRLDLEGAALLVAGVSCLLLVLAWGGRQHPWLSATIGWLAAVGAVLSLAFVFWEQHAREPLLPLRLFRSRVFTVCNALSFVQGAAMLGGVVFLPVFLQTVQGASATNSGLLILPVMSGMIVMSATSGRVIARTGRYRAWPIAGTAVATLGAALLSTMDEGTSRPFTLFAMALFGAGMGMVMQVLITASQNAASMQDIGVVTSSVNFFRSLGSSVGVATYGAIFAARSSSVLEQRLPGSPSLQADALGRSPDKLRSLPTHVHEALTDAVTSGVTTVFRVIVPLVLIGFVLAWLLPEVPLKDSIDGEPTLPG